MTIVAPFCVPGVCVPLRAFAAFALNVVSAAQIAALEIQPEVVYKSVGLRYGRTPSFKN